MTTIKNSIKTLVINNLCRIFKDEICFVGSICDYFYAGLPLENVKDLDIRVELSKKQYCIEKLLFSDFFVYTEDNKKFTVKPYKTYPPIRNFGIHGLSYENIEVKTFKYCYHLFIFGVSLDISFYFDSPYLYSRYKRFSNRSNSESFFINNKSLPQKNDLYIQSRNHRFLNLCEFQFIAEKHKSRLSLYKNKDTKNYEVMEEYKLPKNFDPARYRNNYANLQVLDTKDGLIDHYLAHGIEEKREI